MWGVTTDAHQKYKVVLPKIIKEKTAIGKLHDIKHKGGVGQVKGKCGSMLQCEIDFFIAFKFRLTIQLFAALKAKQRSELNYRNNTLLRDTSASEAC